MSKKPKGAKPQGKPKGRPGGAGAGTKTKIAKAPKHKNTKPKKGGGAALQDVPLVGRVEDEGEVSDLELSDEDLEFVQKHSRRLGFLESLDQSELDKSIRAKQEKQAKQQAEERKRAAEGEGSEDGEGEEDEGDEGDDDEEAEDGAEAYERAPRRVKADKDKSAAGLPIKTLTGDLLYDKAAAAAEAAARKGRRGGEPGMAMEAAVAAAAAVQVEGVIITDDMEAALVESKRKAREEAERRAKEEKKKVAAAAKKAEESALPPALRGLNLSDMEPAERRQKLQEVMAASAQKLLAVAGPDAAGAVAAELRTLQSLVADADSMVSRLAMLSLLAVFKDILPGYRIRPPTDKEQEVKVSKDVAKMRDYEQALLKSYQTYLRSLLEAAQCVAKRTGTLSHSRVAVRCLAGLLAGLPHFNYTSDILQAVVPRMASGDAETRSMACEAVGALLSGGEGGDETGSGRAALEAVQLVADLIKRRKCSVPPEVVRTLAVLRFRDVIRAKAGEDQEEERRKKGKKAEKRDVKRRRKEDEVSRAFKEANAGPDTAELAKQQSLMLEALFEVYFRVLKHATSVGLSGPGGSARAAAATADAVAAATGQDDQGLGPSSSSGGDVGPRVPSTSAALPWPRSKLLKKCPLLHPVLDGLAKYTHLISVDYMNDLLDVFSQLLAAPTLPLPERLRLLATTAAVLRGQGEALNVDRRDLYVQLYDALLQIPLYPLLADDVLGGGGGGGGGQHNPEHGDEQEEEEDEEAADNREFSLAAACEAAAAAAADAAAAASAAAAGAAAAAGGYRSRRLPAAFGAAARSQAGLLAGVVEALLCEPKMADMQRAAAFVKRLAGAALASGPGEAMALWAAVARLLRRYPKLANLLEYEGEAPTIGGRPYDPWATDPSEAGGLACCLWEVALAGGGGVGAAGVHYHPHLAQAANSLLALRPAAAAAAMAQGGGSVTLAGPLGTPATIPELAEAYDASRGLLRPTPPLPAGAGKKTGGGPAPKRLVAGVTAAAASLTPGFISELEGLAAEYGEDGDWPDLVLDTDSDSDKQDEQGAEGEEDGEDRIGGGGDAAAAAAALRRMWRESRRFLANRRLRRQKAMEVERLKRFHIHLHRAPAEAAAQGQAQGQQGQKGQAAGKGQAQANGHAAAAVHAVAAGGKPGDKRKR